MTSRHPTLVVGFATDDLLDVASAVSSVLDVLLTLRASSHYGGDYFRGDTDPPEDLRVFRNLDPVDGTAQHGSADRHPVVLRVLDTDRDPEEVVSALRDVLAADVDLVVPAP